MTRTHSTSLIILLAAASGLAAAGPDEGAKQDKDLLRGPRVVDSPNAKPGDAPATAPDPMSDRSMRPAIEDRPLLFSEVARTLRQLDAQGEGTLHLTDAQRSDLRKIMIENRRKIREFQQEHREQFRKLREAARPQGRPGAGSEGAPDQKRPADATDRPLRAADPHPDNASPKTQNTESKNPETRRPETRSPAPDRAAQAREKLTRFLETAPANREALDKIRKLLTPEQNETLRQHILAERQRMHEQGRRPGAPAGVRRPGDGQNSAPRVQRRRMDRDRVNDAQPHDKDQNKNQDKPARDKPAGDDD